MIVSLNFVAVSERFYDQQIYLYLNVGHFSLFWSRFFSARVVDSRNKLNAQTLEARTAEDFKTGQESEVLIAREAKVKWFCTGDKGALYTVKLNYV